MQTEPWRQTQEEWSLQREYHGVIQRSRSLLFHALWAWLVYRRTRGLQCHGGRAASFVFTVNSGRSVWSVRNGRCGAAEARGGREARRALGLPRVSSGLHCQHLHRRKVRKKKQPKSKYFQSMEFWANRYVNLPQCSPEVRMRQSWLRSPTPGLWNPPCACSDRYLGGTETAVPHLPKAACTQHRHTTVNTRNKGSSFVRSRISVYWTWNAFQCELNKK